MKKLMAVLAVAGTFYFNAAKAQTETGAPGGQADTVAMNFIVNASTGGMKEVNTGKLAEQKAQSQSVKMFAEQMVNDHTKANMELMKIAKMEHYNVPPPADSMVAPDPMLTQLSGADFDKAYVKMMVTDHEKTIAIFQNASSNAADTDIKSFASETLPTLKKHLKEIKTIATQMGIATN